MIPRQCAILVGELGVQSNHLSAELPKPLLGCGGREFLAWVLRELTRFGVREVVLLTGCSSAKIESFCRDVHAWLPKPLSIKISIAPETAGTAGALWHARDLLQEQFLLINGETWFDTNLARLYSAATRNPEAVGVVLLRRVEDCSRFGSVELEGDHVVASQEKAQGGGRGIINSGIYLLKRRVLDFIQPMSSLEKDVLPVLAKKRALAGQVLEGYFFDVGTPEDYFRACIEMPARMNRPAVFLDRDGVINDDLGWVGSADRFNWIPGAKETLRLMNDLGYHVFLVTNQSGVARGYFSEQDVEHLHSFVLDDLNEFGGTIDDIRFCPDHPDAAIDRYRRSSEFRKPSPGMILDLMTRWNTVAADSLLIGDKESDLEAAKAAGIKGYQFKGGNLLDFVKDCVPLPASRRIAVLPAP